VLENLVEERWEKILAGVAVAVFAILVVVSISVNVFYSAHYPPTDWRSCCPSACNSYPTC